MPSFPSHPGFDGLLRLSHREGIDIRPTLLRVLTDLYVRSNTHSADEERQFTELVMRLSDQVDDATRAAVRARLSIYPHTPAGIVDSLSLRPADPSPPLPKEIRRAALLRMETSAAPATPGPDAPLLQTRNAADIDALFMASATPERLRILEEISRSSLRQAARIPTERATIANQRLEQAAFARDVETFTHELGEALLLPLAAARRVVEDDSGEPLACAMKALAMPDTVFQRVLLFLRHDVGSSVPTVFRLARLYDNLDQRIALTMLDIWRTASLGSIRVRHRPALHDDERHRARPSVPQGRTSVQPGSVPLRTGTDSAD